MSGVIFLFDYLNRRNDSMGTSIEEGAVDSQKKANIYNIFFISSNNRKIPTDHFYMLLFDTI